MFAFNTVLKASLVAFSTCLALSVTSACSDDDKAPAGHDDDHHLDYCDLPQACKDIIEVCHSKDDGTAGDVHDCHETAHDEGDEAACEAVHDDCIQKCNDAPSLGEPTPMDSCEDGGSSDHDHDG